MINKSLVISGLLGLREKIARAFATQGDEQTGAFLAFDVMARDEFGKITNHRGRKAYAFTLHGAMDRECYERRFNRLNPTGLSPSHRLELWAAMDRALKGAFTLPPYSVMDTSRVRGRYLDWARRNESTQEEVIALLDHAIQFAETHSLSELPYNKVRENA